MSDPTVKAAARQAMATAMTQLDSVGIDYTKPWGQLQQQVVGTKRVQIHGAGGPGPNLYLPGRAYADQMYNLHEVKLRGDGTLAPMWGSSYVMTVSFEGGSPKAQGFLTYSQSTDPDNPHSTDQTERYSRKEWISYPFTEAQITSDPAYSVIKMTTK